MNHPRLTAARRAALHLGCLGALLALGACAVPVAPVQAWEKGHLAKPEMAFDNDPLRRGFLEHVYSSREAASGGAGVAGGGCGCN